MHQIRFRLGLRPRARWGSSALPPSWILGVLLLRGGRGEEGRAKGKGRERRGGRERERKGRKGKWKERGGKGRGRPSGFAPPPPEKFPSYATGAGWHSIPV